jgi:prephenate dehydratase
MSSNIDAEHSIAFMGVEGANADLACRQNYPYMKTLAFHSFEDVFNAVAEGRAKYAMIPIENSQAGRVAEIHNLLPRTNLHIVAEHIQPIEHHLYSVAGATLESVTNVYSHHQGLLQCRGFIGKHKLTTHIHDNTATAAGILRKLKNRLVSTMPSAGLGSTGSFDSTTNNVSLSSAS